MPDQPIVPETLPQSGGSWIRNPDGTLTQVTPPTIVPETAPIGDSVPTPKE